MSVRKRALNTYRALLNGSGELVYFGQRRFSVKTLMARTGESAKED